MAAAALAVAAAFWWFQGRRPAPTADAISAPPVAPAASRLELGVESYAAGASDDIVVVVRLFDADARQAEAIRAATGGRWKGSASAIAAAPVTLPQGWADRVQLTRSDGGTIDVRERVNGPGDAVRLVVAALPPGTVLAASLDVVVPNVRSNNIEIEQAPATRLDAAVARGRIAEVLERWDALTTVADELIALNERSPWGHYYQGLVARARGDAEGERAAFQRALNRIEPGEEMPRGLRPE